MGKVKVQISIDEKLLSRVDAYSDKCCISRSGVFSMAASQLVNDDYVKKLNELIECIKIMAKH